MGSAFSKSRRSLPELSGSIIHRRGTRRSYRPMMEQNLFSQRVFYPAYPNNTGSLQPSDTTGQPMEHPEEPRPPLAEEQPAVPSPQQDQPTVASGLAIPLAVSLAGFDLNPHSVDEHLMLEQQQSQQQQSVVEPDQQSVHTENTTLSAFEEPSVEANQANMEAENNPEEREPITKRFYLCPICPQIFMGFGQFHRHVWEAHTAKFECVLCAKEFDQTTATDTTLYLRDWRFEWLICGCRVQYGNLQKLGEVTGYFPDFESIYLIPKREGDEWYN